MKDNESAKGKLSLALSVCPRSLRRWTLRIALACLIAAGVPFVAFHVAVMWWVYPSSVDRPPAASLLIEDRTHVELAALASDEHQWHIPLVENQINPHLLKAIVAVEDSRFYQHHGVDWTSVLAAMWQDMSHLSARRGASTLTMQLYRLRDPAPRTFAGKITQAIRAEQLEQRESKRQILIDYVNRAPFGGNLVGAGAASWRYFGKPCKSLSLGQAALLAGLPQSPNRLRPDRYPQRALARRNHVLDRMLACGMIAPNQRDEAAAEPIGATWRPLPQDRVADDLPPADGALPALLKLTPSRNNGIVRTTLDAVTQRQAALAAQEHLRSWRSSGISAAAVVVLDTQTSQCLATVSLGSADGSIDLAERPRSTGSVLKPLIYAAAFDAGIVTPESVLLDSPTAWPGYQPADYDRSFRGPLTAAEALAQSRNIPALVVLSKVGIEPAIGVMDACGLHGLARHPNRYGLSLAIGGAEASPMEVAEAYATLGRGGITRPVTCTIGEHRLGGETSGTASQTESARRSLGERACWQALNSIAAPTRTSAVWPEAAASHVAWKTGTSSGHRDAWCAAVTHRRTVVVWLGNVSGQGSPALIGQDAAAPLALQLIAMFDPADEPWPIVASPKSSNLRPAVASSNSTNLVMVCPVEGQQFVLTGDVPRSRQQVLLMASCGNSASDNLWWFVDGKPIGRGGNSKRTWWDPVIGAHEIRAVDCGGHTVRAHIFVRE
jgi:penicillin-binding protein 1C